MAAALQIEFDDGRRAMERTAETGVDAFRSAFAPEEYYDIGATADAIRAAGASRVALQFPDHLLGDSAFVIARIQHVGADFLVHFGDACLSPTSRIPVRFVFGKAPCDAGAVAGAVAAAVAGGASDGADVGALPRVLVVCSCLYAHASEEIERELRARLELSQWAVLAARAEVERAGVVAGAGVVAASAAAAGCACRSAGGDCAAALVTAPESGAPGPAALSLLGRPVRVAGGGSRGAVAPASAEELNAEGTVVAFVGAEGEEAGTLALQLPRSRVVVVDPAAGGGAEARDARTRANRELMRRYAVVERCRDADVFGIVAGTLGAGRYMAAIERLRALIHARGRRSYLLSVGRINVPKLANFREVDVFVHVACPRTTLVKDAAEHVKPIATPWDVETALNPAMEWTGDYSTDFDRLLALAAARGEGALEADTIAAASTAGATAPAPAPGVAAAAAAEAEASSDSETEAAYSLAQGRIVRRRKRQARPGVAAANASGSALALRVGETAVVAFQSPAAEYLRQQEFQGLQPRIGEDEVHAAREGQIGTASGYRQLEETGAAGRGEEGGLR